MHSKFWVRRALRKMTCHNECATWTSVFITSWITISPSFLHAWLSHNYHLKWDRSELNEMVVCTSGHAAFLDYLIRWGLRRSTDGEKKKKKNCEGNARCSVTQQMDLARFLQELLEYDWLRVCMYDRNVPLIYYNCSYYFSLACSHDNRNDVTVRESKRSGNENHSFPFILKSQSVW